MDKITLNLLPPELLNIKHTSAKRSLLLTISIGVLVVMIGITGTLLFVNLIQNQALNQATEQNQAAKQQLNSLSSQQSAIYSLKQRVDTISSLTSNDSTSKQIFDLVASLLPPNIIIEDLSISNKGSVTLSVKANDSPSLETLINNLLDPAQNKGQITKATLDGLSLKGDLIYNAEIALVMKNASPK